jgi:hypothetical protein
MQRATAALLLVLISAGAAGAQSCRLPQQPMLEIELMFGRNIGGRLGVSEAAWSRFVAREIATRFPEGFTIIDAMGRWHDRRAGVLVREPSKLVQLVIPAEAQDKIDAVTAAYKSRFRQQAVGVTVRSVCAAF